MEFTNEIFFNKNLIENETIILTYMGKLYREHSAEISIVYGFGDNWEYTNEIKMKEIENGFEATINLMNYNTFNFCFKNNYNIWDNNFGFNYIAPISPKVENIVEENNQILTNNETSNLEEINKEISEPFILEENESSNEINSTSEKIESVFASLLDSILDMKPYEKNEDINLENGFGLQSVDEIKEDESANYDKKNSQLSTSELDMLFNKIFENSTDVNEHVEIVEEKTELDNLMDNILDNIENSDKYDSQITSSIQNSSETTEILNHQEYDSDNFTESNLEEDLSNNEENLDEELETTENTVETIDDYNIPTTENSLIEALDSQKDINVNISEVSDLPVIVENNDTFEKFLEASYTFLKKVGSACKKVGSIIKLKAQEHGIIKK